MSTVATQQESEASDEGAKVIEMKKKKIHLDKQDIRWCENIHLKEQHIKRQADDVQKQLNTALQDVAKDAESMMEELSAKHGSDLRGYNIDWKTGIATMPEEKPDKGGDPED